MYGFVGLSPHVTHNPTLIQNSMVLPFGKIATHQICLFFHNKFNNKIGIVAVVVLVFSDITQVILVRIFYPNWATFQRSIMDLRSAQFESSFCRTVVER